MATPLRASNGRGVASVRVLDSGRGEIPPTDYQVDVIDSTLAGVPQTVELTYESAVRPESYDVTIEAVDGGGAVSSFTIALRDQLEFRETAAYPNPFSDATDIVFDIHKAAWDTDPRKEVHIYTVNGRKIWEASAEAVANQNSIRWDGRDSGGLPVANGTYLVRVKVSGATNTIETTFPVVKMH